MIHSRNIRRRPSFQVRCNHIVPAVEPLMCREFNTPVQGVDVIGFRTGDRTLTYYSVCPEPCIARSILRQL